MIFQNFGFNSLAVPAPKPPLSIEWLLVGGGGSSGRTNGSYATGGGGAGRFLSSSVEINEQEIIVAIGLGGAAVTSGNSANDGQSSIVAINDVTYIAPGGGGGGAYQSSYSANGSGRNGGSGGGQGEEGNFITLGGDAIAGTGLAGFGSDAERQSGGSTFQSETAGGGAGGAGIDTSPGMAWVNGVTYAVGGPSLAGGNASTTAGSGGKSTIGAGTNSTAGKDGIFIIRYAGSQKATGGTITSSGGYTYHTFTEDGTFVY